VGQRSWWGWGDEERAISGVERDELGAMVQKRLGVTPPGPSQPPSLDALTLRPSRVAAPAALASLLTDAIRERAAHTHGKSFRDVVRNLRGVLENPPDLVATPGDESDVVAVLDWASAERIAVIPYGGGSSVVGGVEPNVGNGYRGAVSLDLSRIDRVLDVDATSLAARIQAGALGPSIEEQLAPHGVTLRHQPQSFEFSTLGGWIATRSAGHYATLQTRIDDRVESLRVLTPRGIVETRRLPASGAGPDPNALWIGSEGVLGVITEAWVRVVRRPVHRSSATVQFVDFGHGCDAVRALAQAELYPANCRLLDPFEALINGVSQGSAVMFLSFESADHTVEPSFDRAIELVRDAGGTVATEHAAGEWRRAFVRAPYVRDALITLGMIVETFESATTWDRLPALLDAVHESGTNALDRLGIRGLITCRITHGYSDGAAPYWTVIGFGDPNSQVEQWDEVKSAVSDVIATHGATITHHHAVGRDHRPWYDGERPALFADSMRAAKNVLDPAGILNPGVLIDAVPASG
jgi:alkyldihydroxyacetonephosphate synthase